MAERRKPSREESDLWREAMKDARPIRTRRRIAAAKESGDSGEAAEPVPAAKPARIRRAAAAPARPAPPKTPTVPALSHGEAAGLDRRTLDRLRRGQMPVEAEIDLHGHTQDAAHRALTGFILGQAASGRRCLRVITGKGFLREGRGVLKEAVPRWLNEAPLRELVLAFSHARRDDGGEGALYVLLRRKRVTGAGA